MDDDFNFLAKMMLKVYKILGIDFAGLMPDKRMANFVATLGAIGIMLAIFGFVFTVGIMIAAR